VVGDGRGHPEGQLATSGALIPRTSERSRYERPPSGMTGCLSMALTCIAMQRGRPRAARSPGPTRWTPGRGRPRRPGPYRDAKVSRMGIVLRDEVVSECDLFLCGGAGRAQLATGLGCRSGRGQGMPRLRATLLALGRGRLAGLPGLCPVGRRCPRAAGCGPCRVAYVCADVCADVCAALEEAGNGRRSDLPVASITSMFTAALPLPCAARIRAGAG
jgi:hypothetical protein